jgi:EpsI family protein
LVIYWYESHGRIVASEYEAKFYLILGSIRGNRSDGALVRLITPLTDTEKPGAAQERATEFAEATLPLLNDYIPQ